jgi:hypothetical protein
LAFGPAGAASRDEYRSRTGTREQQVAGFALPGASSQDRHMPILVTITGPIAAGKNTVATLLADR